jgi:ribosomal-protein-alanine N-acetyltransferase
VSADDCLSRVRITTITEQHAADIVTWRYPEPYRCYDLVGAEPAYFLDPANGFFALVDEGGELIGYRSFGPDGQVPGGAYDDAALDTGGGLRPELTGRGLGRRSVATGLAFGRERFHPAAFRVTVAQFNSRARRVVESLGFGYASTFVASTDGSHFNIFLLKNHDIPSRLRDRIAQPNAGGCDVERCHGGWYRGLFCSTARWRCRGRCRGRARWRR